MGEAQQAVFNGERDVRTYVDLSHGADVLLHKAIASPEGSAYTSMGSLILRAFAFEAFLNHLGERHLGLWTADDRKSVKNKYRAAADRLGHTIDLDGYSNSSLMELIDFRNRMAHGRSEILQETREVAADADPYELIPRASWEGYCTSEEATVVMNDVTAIISSMHKLAGLGDYAFMHGIGFGSLSLKT